MFRKYGLLGILLIVFVEVNFFLKIQPFANWYFPLVWFGYIFVIDALIYKLKGNSMISNRFSEFLGMVVASAVFWWVFEFINDSVGNWSYSGLEAFFSERLLNLMGTISFATVVPAVMETAELFRT